MKLSKEQIDFINMNEWVVFATADKKSSTPRAAVVIPSRVESDRIIISDVQMGITAKNVKSNQQVFISSYAKDMGKWIKITGTAKYVENGDLFQEIHDYELTRNALTKAIIIVSVENVQEGIG